MNRRRAMQVIIALREALAWGTILLALVALPNHAKATFYLALAILLRPQHLRAE